MNRILFLTVLIFISFASFSQEAVTSKGKPVAQRKEYCKSALGVGNYTEKQVLFEPSVSYNWAFNNIETDADKVVLKNLTQALVAYGIQVKSETVSGSLLLFTVTFSKQLSSEELKSATNKINVRLKARDFTVAEPAKAKPTIEVAK